MRLHNMVMGTISQVNPTMDGVLYRSKGYGLSPYGKQVPNYEPAEPVQLQIQSLNTSELKQIDFVNQQAEKKAIYLQEQVHGVDRVRGMGGDIIEVMGRRWLVVQRLESWEGSVWCKVAVVAQLDAPQEDDAMIADYV